MCIYVCMCTCVFVVFWSSDGKQNALHQLHLNMVKIRVYSNNKGNHVFALKNDQTPFIVKWINLKTWPPSE